MNNRIEICAAIRDYVKHVNTLSTGSIVLLVSFVTNKTEIISKGFLTTSIVCLILAIIMGVIAQMTLLYDFDELEQNDPGLLNKLGIVGGVAFYVHLLAFIFGITFLGIFGIQNL